MVTIHESFAASRVDTYTFVVSLINNLSISEEIHVLN